LPANNTADGNGFVLRRSQLGFEKQWSDSLMKAVFTTDVIRNHELSNDTAVNGGSRQDPYLAYVSNAFVQNSFFMGPMYASVRLGVQEVPYMYTEKNPNLNLSHVMFTVPEDIHFTPDRSDIGVSFLGTAERIAFQVMLANGEGALQYQGKDSYGFDLISRLSVTAVSLDSYRLVVNVYYRKANIAGYAGNECREGKSVCLGADSDVTTNLKRDIRAIRDDYYGAEAVFTAGSFVSIPFGLFYVRDYGGAVSDLVPGRSVYYDPDRTGRAAYVGAMIGGKTVRFFVRGVQGTGTTGQLTGTVHSTGFLSAVVKQQPAGSLSTSVTLTPMYQVQYGDKSHYNKWTTGVDLQLGTNGSLAFGVERFTSVTAGGEPTRRYVDLLGVEHTRLEYLDQYQTGANRGISQYKDNPVHYFIRAALRF
ncbi:MAG: hypothetical protein HY042_08445, partial [Spirochaetia bacterium]|nr:hypothetical protein [Spirochaetia bacterium]